MTRAQGWGRRCRLTGGAGLLLLATACGTQAASPGAEPAAVVHQLAAEQPLPIFASPHAGDVAVPKALLDASRRERLRTVPSSAASSTGGAAPGRAAPAPATVAPQAPVTLPSPSPTAATVPASTGVPGGATSAGGSAPTAPSGGGDFADLYARARESVGFFLVDGCDRKGYMGTGFLVAPDLVLTDAHVVEGRRWQFRLDGRPRAGRLIGVDRAQDVALVRLTKPVTTPHLTLAAQAPRVGTPIAAIGFALGIGLEEDRPSMQSGIVSGIDRRIGSRTGMLQGDYDANHGSSGGPVLTRDGQVVGVVDAVIDKRLPNVQIAVGAALARTRVQRWSSAPQRVRPSC